MDDVRHETKTQTKMLKKILHIKKQVAQFDENGKLLFALFNSYFYYRKKYGNQSFELGFVK